jgi:NTP pyrophosphatase (non-canonical NTP hydrolase)
MDFNDYQIKARETAIYPELGGNLWYPTLGLCGEAGEVAEKVKKIYRDDKGIITKDKEEELAKELGDVLWYVSNVASELGLSLNFIAELNIAKLERRMTSNKLHGEGDNR